MPGKSLTELAQESSKKWVEPYVRKEIENYAKYSAIERMAISAGLYRKKPLFVTVTKNAAQGAKPE